jgi:LysM repeat protein
MSTISFRGMCISLLILISTAMGYSMEISPLDSVGIEKIGEKTFIIHEVKPQETIFGISRRYNAPVNEIVQNNDNLKEGLKIGQKIKVPYIEKEAVPEGAVLHHVAPGETMFSIAKKYEVKLDEIMTWNKLQGNDLSIGQALVIKGVAEKEAPTPVRNEKLEETLDLGDQKVAVTNKEVDGKKEPKKANSPKPLAESKKEEAEKQPAKNLMPSPSSSVSATKKPESTTTSPAPSSTSSTGGWVSHKVAQGETLFSIAKKYEAKVEDLITWNGLSSNNLSTGQTLKVGREKGANIPVTRFPSGNAPTTGERSAEAVGSSGSSNASGQASEKPKAVNVSASTEFKNITETGQAEVIEGTGNHKKYLVLHRTAPVGTIMRIRNEENDVTIFARVVGALPETGDNGKLVIKVSKAAYDQLRAVNSRFPVEIGY